MKKLIILMAALLVPLAALPAFAAQVRVYVAEVNAIGVQNRDEMKFTLQTLLASRLNNDSILTVNSAAEADAIVNGTYIVIGKVYSFDAYAKSATGVTLGRAFVQGDAGEELIPVVGKLADKLAPEINKAYASGLAVASPAKGGAIVRPQSNIRQVQSGDIIRPQIIARGSSGSYVSKRLPGAANLMAVGATLTTGEREVFLAQVNRVQYFQQGSDTKLLSSIDFKANERVISLDAVDADGNGTQEIYITIARNGELASQVWEVKSNKLTKIADELAYYFRAIGLAGEAKKLYVQEMGRGEDDYYGDVYEATRTGSTIKKGRAIKMPRYGNIYAFNQFRDADGAMMTIVINQDDYLVVYNADMKELWRSNDSFGGSALYFQKTDDKNVRTTGDPFRWIFMKLRIQVTSRNEILVGKNDGMFVIGNSRSYKRGAVYSMAWDGSSLEEVWRTKETQNYMPDYWFDEGRNELLILQMPAKPGPGDEGAASLAIKKVE
jgi:azurin